MKNRAKSKKQHKGGTSKRRRKGLRGTATASAPKKLSVVNEALSVGEVVGGLIIGNIAGSLIDKVIEKVAPTPADQDPEKFNWRKLARPVGTALVGVTGLMVGKSNPHVKRMSYGVIGSGVISGVKLAKIPMLSGALGETDTTKEVEYHRENVRQLLNENNFRPELPALDNGTAGIPQKKVFEMAGPFSSDMNLDDIDTIL